MKSKEEIEQLAKEYAKSLSIKINKTEFTEYAILDFTNGYTQCQQDMADKKYTEEDIVKLMFMATKWDTFKEAIRLATALGVWCEFNFNGVTCLANANGEVEKGVEAYHSEIKKKDGCRMAFA